MGGGRAEGTDEEIARSHARSHSALVPSCAPGTILRSAGAVTAHARPCCPALETNTTALIYRASLQTVAERRSASCSHTHTPFPFRRTVVDRERREGVREGTDGRGTAGTSHTVMLPAGMCLFCLEVPMSQRLICMRAVLFFPP
jgi:hypothetical protein